MTLAIHTERLILRRFFYADIFDLQEFLAHPSVARAVPEIKPSRLGLKDYIDQQNSYERFPKDVCFDLAIELREQSKVIGLLSVTRRDHQQAEIGYALSFNYRGRGFATEATRALIQYALDELHLHRIFASTTSTNQSSWRVMERLGMRQEACFREAESRDGKWADCLVYGILSDEWPALPSPRPSQLMKSSDINLSPWITRQRRTILAHSEFLKVESLDLELPNGRVIENWPWITIPDAAIVVPETFAGKYLCFRQYKLATGETLAPVAGMLEPGENPLVGAQRELREEAGCEASEWLHLGSYRMEPNRGLSTLHMYLARGAHFTGTATHDDLEEQQLLELTRSELESALAAGEFKALMWATAVALALLHLQSLK